MLEPPTVSGGLPRCSAQSHPPSGRLPRIQAGIPEIITLCLYAALLAFAIPYHEPWADEAQAWEIARSLPFLKIFHALAYEGHPGLWYLCLWMMKRLHVSYAGMHWVTGAIALAGVAVLVLRAPFPRFVKLLLPFTFFLAFQYAVVARSYALTPLLLFACASFWPQRYERPVVIALLLGLLANVALHAAIVSGGFAIVCSIDLWLRRRHGPAAGSRRFYAAAALLLALYGAAIWAALPARDTSGAGLVLHKKADAKIIQALGQQQSNVHLNVPPEPPRKSSLAWMNWKIQVRLASGLTHGLTGSFWPGCLFWALVIWKLFRVHKPHYILPAAFFAIFCAEVYASPWHSGIMMLCAITILWTTWPENGRSLWQMPRYEQLVLLFFFMIVLVQIGWAEFAFRFDRGQAYSPAQAAASFLHPFVREHARIVEIGDDFLSVDLQPYFKNKLFMNQPYPYYWWSINNNSKARYQELLAARPDIVVVEWRFKGIPEDSEVASIPLVRQLTSLAYSNTHRFCGGVVEQRRRFAEWDCELIYQPLSHE